MHPSRKQLLVYFVALSFLGNSVAFASEWRSSIPGARVSTSMDGNRYVQYPDGKIMLVDAAKKYEERIRIENSDSPLETDEGQRAIGALEMAGGLGASGYFASKKIRAIRAEGKVSIPEALLKSTGKASFLSKLLGGVALAGLIPVDGSLRLMDCKNLLNQVAPDCADRRSISDAEVKNPVSRITSFGADENSSGASAGRAN